MSPATSIGPEIGSVAARHIDLAMRTLITGPESHHEQGVVRVITGEPHPLGNFAIILEAGDLVSTQASIGPLLDTGAPSSLLYFDRPQGDVAAVVAEGEFLHEENLPAMAIEIDSLAGTSLPEGYDFRLVTGGADAEAWIDAFAAGYGLPLRLAQLFGPEAAAGNDSVRFYGVFQGGRTVATSMMFLADGVAGIYCVSTLETERGKGFGAHATAEPLRHAREEGYKVGVLQSTEMGHPVYKRLGFHDVAPVMLYVRIPE